MPSIYLGDRYDADEDAKREREQRGKKIMTTPVGLEPTLPKEIDAELEVLVNRLNHSAKVSLFDERKSII